MLRFCFFRSSYIDFKLMLQFLLSKIHSVIFFQLIIPDLTLPFALICSLQIGKRDVFMVFQPVYPVPHFLHLIDKIFPAGGTFFTVQNRHGDLLHIALYFSFFGLFQKLVGIFFIRHDIFPGVSRKGFPFLCHMKPLFQTLFIVTFFEIFQIMLAPAKLMSIFITHGIHNKMTVYMSSINVCGN